MKKKTLTIKEVYTDLNVYEASKQRIDYCLNNYDNHVVMFSGGKDSMALLLLVQERMVALGRKEKVNVCYFDEEFVFPEVLETVEEVKKLPFVNFYHVCLSFSFPLGMPDGTIQTVRTWDSTRKLLREVPKDAIMATPDLYLTEGDRIINENIFNSPADKGKKIVILMGLRTEESMARRSMVVKRYKMGAFAFLRKTTAQHINYATPLYDWLFKDVFFYIKNQDVLKLNSLYYIRYIQKKSLRVGSALPGKNRQEVATIKDAHPFFFEKLCEVFPELKTNALYVKHLKVINYDEVYRHYGKNLRGIVKYAKENLGEDYSLAMRRIKAFNTDYLEFDRFKKYGHTHTEAIEFLFRAIVKLKYGQTIMLSVKHKKNEKN